MSNLSPESGGDTADWDRRFVAVELVLGVYVAAATLVGSFPGSLRPRGGPIGDGLGLAALLVVVVLGQWYRERERPPWSVGAGSSRSRVVRYRFALRTAARVLAATTVIHFALGAVGFAVWTVSDPGPMESLVVGVYALIPLALGVGTVILLVASVTARAGLFAAAAVASRLDGEAGVP